MGYYGYFRPKQKSQTTVQRERLLSKSEKILSFNKLESLGKQELEKQKKIYEKENIGLNELLKQYENKVIEYRNFEHTFIEKRKNIKNEYKNLKISFKIKKKYYVQKDFLLFNKVIRKFIFNIFYFDEKIIKRILIKEKELLKLHKNNKKLNDYINYFNTFKDTITVLFSLHKIEDIPERFDSEYWNETYLDSILPQTLIVEETYPKSFKEIEEQNRFTKWMYTYKFKDLTELSETFSDIKDVITIDLPFKNLTEYFKKDDNIHAFHNHSNAYSSTSYFSKPKLIETKIYEEKFLIIKEFNIRTLRKIELLLRSKVKQKEKLENVGYVYVLSNEAYPGIYKIGSTYGLVEERAEELTGTGHLHAFKPEFSIKIESAEYFEKTTHSLLKDYRVKQGREFFKLELNKIKDTLKRILEVTEKGKSKLKLSELKKKIDL